MKNILLIISGPSGVGKGTLCKMLLEADGNFVSSVSCTTRAPREGEEDGREYFFLTRKEFESRIAADGFLEYDEHFEHLYGTPRSFVEEQLRNKSVLLEIEVNGAMKAKSRMPDATTIFVAPPSIEELRDRLCERDTETEEQIAKRLERVEYELSLAPQYDYTLVNDDLQGAFKRLREIIEIERNKNLS